MDEVDPSVKREIYNWVFRSKTLRILVFGKTGTGKSSLINTLLKEQVAEEGAGLYSVTKKVQDYAGTIKSTEKIINDVRITVLDTPGLRDPLTDGKKTLSDILKVRDKIDLFLFCTRMDQTRLGQDDVEAISDLTEALGQDIWNKTILVLTFANRTYPPQGQQSPEFLKSREQEWQAGLRKIIEDYTKDINISNIPVIPAGYKEEPLPGGREWFTPFLLACFAKVNPASIPAFYRVTNARIASTVIAQRLAKIGDDIDEEQARMLGSAVREIDSILFINILNDAIQADETNVLSRTFRAVGRVWEIYGTSVLVVAGAAVCAAILTRQ